MHRRPTTLGRHDQLLQLHDVVGGMRERDQLATVRQPVRVLEWFAPAPLSRSLLGWVFISWVRSRVVFDETIFRRLQHTPETD